MTFVVFGTILLVCAFFYRIKHLRASKIKSSSDILINKISAQVIPVFIISLLIGLRYDVGVDYPVYKDIYEQLTSSNLKWSLENSGVETLYTLICVLLHNLNVPYYGMFFVMALIPMIFYYRSFKNIRFLFFYSTFFLFASGVFFWYMNIMRQGIAFFILLYSIQYIISKSFPKFIITVIVASGFHLSSILFIPCYVFTYIKRPLLTRSIVMVLYMATWVFAKKLISFLFLLATPFLGGTYIKYANILQTWEMSGGSGLGVLALHMADLMLIYISPICFRVFKQYRYDVYYNIFILGALFSNIAGLNMILSRIPFAFISMRIIISAFSVWYIFKNWRSTLTQYRVAICLLLLANIAYFAGNLLNLDYNFISL